jgi:hypothetical protein
MSLEFDNYQEDGRDIDDIDVIITVFENGINIRPKKGLESWFLLFNSIRRFRCITIGDHKCGLQIFLIDSTSLLFSIKGNDKKQNIINYKLIEEKIRLHLFPAANANSIEKIVADTIRATIDELALTPVTGAEFRSLQAQAVETHGMSK